MPLDAKQLWLWLVVTAGMTVVAMVIGAATNNQSLAMLAGMLFVVVAVIAGWRMAALLPTRADGAALAFVSARFARLLGITWGWCGAAMLATYYLTDLTWQHAWQYGLAMLFVAAGVAWFSGQRERNVGWPASPSGVQVVRLATTLQGVGALAAIFWLTLSGKLQPEGRDWAANIVFVAGGLALFSQSMAALRAERRVMGHDAKR